MSKLEVYFDYTCPYCYKGLKELAKLREKYDIDIDWFPCEAHPRPEFAPVHSDLATQTLIFIKENNLNASKFNDLVYNAHFEEGKKIDDIKLLSEFAALCGADKEEVYKLLSENKYADKVIANNNLVWEDLAFEAVPSYRKDNKIAFSSGGKLVDIKEVENLIK